MIKPILVPTEFCTVEIGDMCFKDNKLYLPTKTKEECLFMANEEQIEKCFHIILIDTEAEIVEGDLFYNTLNKYIVKATNRFVQSRDTIKIISSTNKSHKLYESETLASASGFSLKTDDIFLPQLSPQSIQLLINYYNKHKSVPESVEIIEYDCGEAFVSSDNITGLQTILNQQGEVDITIPEVEEKLYTESEVVDIVFKFSHDNTYITDYDVKEWFNSKKK